MERGFFFFLTWERGYLAEAALFARTVKKLHGKKKNESALHLTVAYLVNNVKLKGNFRATYHHQPSHPIPI
jgi:hypothetical protein